jgi:hypothetical protein
VVVIFGMLAIATAHWLLSARHHFVGPRRLTQPHVFLSAKEIGDLQEIAERASSGRSKRTSFRESPSEGVNEVEQSATRSV